MKIFRVLFMFCQSAFQQKKTFMHRFVVHSMDLLLIGRLEQAENVFANDDDTYISMLGEEALKI